MSSVTAPWRDLRPEPRPAATRASTVLRLLPGSELAGLHAQLDFGHASLSAARPPSTRQLCELWAGFCIFTSCFARFRSDSRVTKGDKSDKHGFGFPEKTVSITQLGKNGMQHVITKLRKSQNTVATTHLREDRIYYTTQGRRGVSQLRANGSRLGYRTFSSSAAVWPGWPPRKSGAARSAGCQRRRATHGPAG